MANLNLVLVEPQIPQNTGNIARTCAATGAALHLIQPLGFQLDDSKLKRAGLDYWHYLTVFYYKDLEDFFARTEGHYFFFTTKGRTVHSDAVYPDNSYLLFGREDAGLPEELLVQHPESCLRLPMIEGVRSLNLSNTVAVATFEVLRQWGYPNLSGQGNLHNFSWETLQENL